ncbi:hypothetical protein, partial [Comamonas aquatica]|uniref:hypothetical protein n=2 Tax=Comamonas aquatica TaxID=225991 RepID=UPI002448A9BF
NPSTHQPINPSTHQPVADPSTMAACRPQAWRRPGVGWYAQEVSVFSETSGTRVQVVDFLSHEQWTFFLTHDC